MKKTNHFILRCWLLSVAFFCTLLLSNTRSAAQQKIKPKLNDTVQYFVLADTLKGFAVNPFFDTLFILYNRVGSFSPQERSMAVIKRIKKLGDDYYFTKNSLKLVAAEKNTEIVYGESIILSISDKDAAMMNATRQQVAEKYKNQITDAVIQYKKVTSFRSKLQQLSLALLVIAIIFLVVYLINKFFIFTRIKIEHQKGKNIKGIRFRGYTFIDAGKHTELLIAINGFVKLVTLILILFLALPLLFGVFPPTERFANILLELIKTPVVNIFQGIWNYIPKFISIAIIIIVFHYVLRLLKFLKNEIEKKKLKIPGFHTDWASPTYQIMRILIYAFVLILIFPYLPGFGSPIFNGISIFLGALVTFGSSTSLGNIVSGLALTYMRSFKDGDRVKIGDVTGDIVEKNLLVTRVRTIKNEVISIPNSNVLNNHAINFSKDAPDRGLILHTTITIGYDIPWKKVHEITIKAALATNRVEADPAPFIYQTSLDDFYVCYQVNVYTRYANNQASIYSELHQNILDQFNQAGIEMLSPHYHALRDGNMMAVPAENVPKDYKTPSVRIMNTGN